MNQHHITNKIFHSQNFSCLKNFIPTKFSHVHETKFPKCIMNIFIQAHNTKFSQIQCPQNPSQNSSNNITDYQHYQNFISHQHCPSYTMIKNKHFKNAPKPTLQHDQSYNTPNSNKNTTKWQCLTIKFSMKHETTFFQAKKPKEKLTLMSMWEYGARVLGSWRSPSSSCQSNVGSYFLPWKVRKEDPLEEEDILMQRKMGLKMGSTKNGCVAKVLKKPQGSKKILREMDEGRLRSLEKCFYFYFLFLEEMVKWRRKIKWKKVNSVNGGREGDEGGSKKRDMNGGPKFDPHIKVTAELLSQLPKKKILFFLFPFLFHS